MPLLRKQNTFQAKKRSNKNKGEVKQGFRPLSNRVRNFLINSEVRTKNFFQKMDVSKETEQKIGQLQMFEQSLQSFLGQKQQFQIQLVEVDSALSELENTEKAYKIVGNIMVEADKNELKSELKSRKEMLELRIKTMERQESQVREKASKLQSEILKKMKKED